jgi:hypothetical protein
LRTLQRLESGETTNPPLRYLVNCALALGVEFTSILEDEWVEWLALSKATAEPPAPPGRRSPR